MSNFIQEMQEARSQTVSFLIDLKDVTPKSRESIEVKGKTIPITHQAFKDLLKIAGITNQMLVHLNDTLNPNAGFILIKELTKAIAGKGGRQKVNLIINKEDQIVARIAFDISGDQAPIAPGAIEELMKELTSNKKIDCTQTLITDNGTKVSFNVRYNVEIPLKMPGETICFGKQISWDMFGPLELFDLIERQICRNGMTAIEPAKHGVQLTAGSDPSEWYNTLYKDLMSPNKKIIDRYETKALEAMQTSLSVYEFNKIKGHVLAIWRDDIDRIVRALGDDRDWKIKYENKGIDLEKVKSSQLRNCPTPVNAWDAINLLTDLASHQYNTPVSATSKKLTQKMAGQLLNSNWDENSWMDNLPKFDLKRKI